MWQKARFTSWQSNQDKRITAGASAAGKSNTGDQQAKLTSPVTLEQRARSLGLVPRSRGRFPAVRSTGHFGRTIK